MSAIFHEAASYKLYKSFKAAGSESSVVLLTIKYSKFSVEFS